MMKLDEISRIWLISHYLTPIKIYYDIIDKGDSALQTNPRLVKHQNVFNHNTSQAAIRKEFKFAHSAAMVKGFEPKSENTSSANTNVFDDSFNLSSFPVCHSLTPKC